MRRARGPKKIFSRGGIENRWPSFRGRARRHEGPHGFQNGVSSEPIIRLLRTFFETPTMTLKGHIALGALLGVIMGAVAVFILSQSSMEIAVESSDDAPALQQPMVVPADSNAPREFAQVRPQRPGRHRAPQS